MKHDIKKKEKTEQNKTKTVSDCRNEIQLEKKLPLLSHLQILVAIISPPPPPQKLNSKIQSHR